MTLFGQEITFGRAKRGSVIRLKQPYKLHSEHEGYKTGVIVEEIDNERFGVHLFGYTFKGRRITVDFHKDDFEIRNQLDV